MNAEQVTCTSQLQSNTLMLSGLVMALAMALAAQSWAVACVLGVVTWLAWAARRELDARLEWLKEDAERGTPEQLSGDVRAAEA